MEMEAEQLYTIGEVAAILGVSTHTIRAWERRTAWSGRFGPRPCGACIEKRTSTSCATSGWPPT